MWPAFEVKGKARQNLSLAVGRVGLQCPMAARVGRVEDGSLGKVIDLKGDGLSCISRIYIGMAGHTLVITVVEKLKQKDSWD